MSTFCVAAVVNEPAPILRRFVAWYRALGAARIVLYFDDPSDPELPEAEADPIVQPVRCTAGFWQSLGLTPETRFTLRQNAALSAAYRNLREDWLLAVDADELLFLRAGSVAALLDGQPQDVRSLMIEPAEFVQGPDDAATFRLPIGRAVVNRLYGSDAEIFRKRHGMIGHSVGKAFHRRGQDGIRLRQHWAVAPDGQPVPYRTLGRNEGAHLLHYLAPDYGVWRRKMEWRLASNGFPERVKAVFDEIRAVEADPEAAYAGLYARLHRIGPELRDALRREDALLELAADRAPEAV